MGMGRAHDAHVQLVREADVRDEAPASGDERRIFKAGERLADGVFRHDDAPMSAAAARTAFTMFS